MLEQVDLMKIDNCLQQQNLYVENMNNRKRIKKLKKLKDEYRSKIKTDEYFLGLENASLEEQKFFSNKLKEDSEYLHQIRCYIGKLEQEKKKIFKKRK